MDPTHLLAMLVGYMTTTNLRRRQWNRTFGRHRTLVTCTTAIVVSGTALAFSVNIWMFMVLRMITGAFTVGMLQSSFVLANELVGPSKRAIAGTVIWVHFAVGYMALSLLAFYVRNWRHLQLVVSLLPTILLIIYVRTPESPRWLLSKGRIREATKVMRKLGKINGAEIKETFNLDNVKTGMKVEGGRDQGLVKLLRSPRLRLYTLNLMFQLWGRRPVYIFFMALCGTAILATGFIPFGIGRAAVAMIGKFAITASFCIIYLRACEIIPTPVR
ncbi:solute carrier family 22 member 3 [Strongylocentrotus purpuratus]|uniref:Major facilitator superfamily (MFS) profile domain-containing protein n=1 Tax=Strongylocentrotus purpuratus TaxID=7668 RepID=A0A7M7MZ38_STRPU|nr:solute carrier family 22 member 3 [Strongylocentrotus purpuratus]